MLERGIRKVSQDSRVQYGFSYAMSVQQAFSKSTGIKKDRSDLFTLRQAFFVVAGGLAVETKSFHEEPYLTVTPAGAVELARLGLLNPVPEDVIYEKTKADPIRKLVVCVQAGWFIVQCIARVAHDLPLSLLEIHVLTHVFVALLMYLFWFAKPYDVASPVVITEPKVVQTVALFTLAQRNRSADKPQTTNRCILTDRLPTASDANLGQTQSFATKKKDPVNDGPTLSHDENVGTNSTSNGERDDRHGSSNVAEQAPRSYLSTPANGMDDTLVNTARSHERHRNMLSSSSTLPRSDSHSRGPDSKCSTLIMQKGPLADDTHLCIQPHAAHQSSTTCAPDDSSLVDGHSSSGLHTSTDQQGHHASTALVLAQLAVQRLRSLNIHLTFFVNDEADFKFRSTYVVRSISNFKSNPGFDLSRTKLSMTQTEPRSDSVFDLVAGATLLFVLYAAFHLSAWHAHFPTTTERWLWRGAGLLIVGSPVLWALPSTSHKLRDWIYNAMMNAPRWVKVVYSPVLAVLWTIAVSSALLIPSVAASRLYFLVEAFISLRDPAPRTYETVKWTQSWPHL